MARPIEALIGRTHEIASGGRSGIRPPDAYGTAELATLSQAFLDLASRLMDRTEYMRSFAAHVSHELKSPLTAIRGSAELMRDEGEDMTPAERRKFLDNILQDTDRLTRLVARLRELAQAEMPIVPGATSLAETLGRLRSRFGGLDIRLVGEDVVVPLPAETFDIVFGHLFDNSLQHGATRITLATVREEQGLGFTVADNGAGISEANRARIFEPFFTTRRDAGGTGMGLDIVRALLRAQHADITLESGEGGTTFLIIARDGQGGPVV